MPSKLHFGLILFLLTVAQALLAFFYIYILLDLFSPKMYST